MPTLKWTFLAFLLLAASGVNGNNTTTATLFNVYATELYQNNALPTDPPVPNDISAISLDGHGGTVYVGAVTLTASDSKNISIVKNVSFVEAASWVYVSESLYPPDSNSFNTVELNCTLTNGTTSECIEVESTQGENEAITTTSFSGQVVPFTVITGPIPTQTQKSAAVTIVGNPIFNSVLNLLGIFFVLGILLSS